MTAVLLAFAACSSDGDAGGKDSGNGDSTEAENQIETCDLPDDYYGAPTPGNEIAVTPEAVESALPEGGELVSLTTSNESAQTHCVIRVTLGDDAIVVFDIFSNEFFDVSVDSGAVTVGPWSCLVSGVDDVASGACSNATRALSFTLGSGEFTVDAASSLLTSIASAN